MTRHSKADKETGKEKEVAVEQGPDVSDTPTDDQGDNDRDTSKDKSDEKSGKEVEDADKVSEANDMPQTSTENDPDAITDESKSGSATAEDGIHDVVQSKETPRSETAPVTALRRNIDDFTQQYTGQLYHVLATNKEGKEIVVGYTNAADGGGMIELVDASPDLKGPVVIRLTDEERTHLNNDAYQAKGAAEAQA